MSSAEDGSEPELAHAQGKLDSSLEIQGHFADSCGIVQELHHRELDDIASSGRLDGNREDAGAADHSGYELACKAQEPDQQ